MKSFCFFLFLVVGVGIAWTTVDVISDDGVIRGEENETDSEIIDPNVL